MYFLDLDISYTCLVLNDCIKTVHSFHEYSGGLQFIYLLSKILIIGNAGLRLIKNNIKITENFSHGYYWIEN